MNQLNKNEGSQLLMQCLACGLFFASGFSALVYEVVWSRMLVLLFGNTILATSVILAAFMTGLSFGSFLLGHYVDGKRTGMLGLYGMLEITIGLFAGAFPFLMKGVMPIDAWVSDLLGANKLLELSARFLLCFALVLVPTSLMGGTFAVIGKYLIQRSRKLGRDGAVLYGLNTAGALLGAFFAGFLLIEVLGHSRTVWLAAAVNLLAGAVALLCDRHVSKSPVSLRSDRIESPKACETSMPLASSVVVLAVIGIGVSGFCALAYQVLWTRLLILIIDNSIYALTVILMCFLAGIATGSLVLGTFFDRLPQPTSVLGGLQIGISITGLLFPLLLNFKPIGPFAPYYLLFFRGELLVVFLAAVLMGASLPLVAQIYQTHRRHVGSTLGNVYAINTVGGVMGAITAGFFFIPVLGFHTSSMVLPMMNLAVGTAILMAPGKVPVRIGCVFLGLVILVLGIRYMPPHIFKDKYRRLEPGSEMIYYNEGSAATASIFERPDGTRCLYLNGIAEVPTDKVSVKTFKVMGSLPGMLHPNPSQALVITFGGGITSGTAVEFVERLHCVELVQQVEGIASFFERENNNVVNSQKVSIYNNDGRRYLLTTKNRYSLIIADATHPRGYDSWVLYTKEFYELARSRLEPDGVFCQWVPFHGIDLKSYLSIVRTFMLIYPHMNIWRIDDVYCLLIGSQCPLKINFGRFRQRMADKIVREDLRRVGVRNLFDLLSYFSMGEKGIRKMLEGYNGIITDDSPYNLFFTLDVTRQQQYHEWRLANFRQLFKYEESIIPYLTHYGATKNQKAATINGIRMYQRKNF